jgi:hypothetical protein
MQAAGGVLLNHECEFAAILLDDLAFWFGGVLEITLLTIEF